MYYFFGKEPADHVTAKLQNRTLPKNVAKHRVVFFCGAVRQTRNNQWRTLNGNIGKLSSWSAFFDESDGLLIGL